MKKAFTLAEVLITLGIIGVVVAMTLPALMTNYKKHVVETRLKHFYSTINQAIAASEAYNGDKQYWFGDDTVGGVDDTGISNKLKWAQTYLLPYINVIRYETNFDKYGESITSDVPVFFLANGSAFASINGGKINRDWVLWTKDPRECSINKSDNYGSCIFWFYYDPTAEKGLEPWGINKSDGDIYNDCESGTFHYSCTAMIARNGWKIPKNYPRKIR